MTSPRWTWLWLRGAWPIMSSHLKWTSALTWEYLRQLTCRCVTLNSCCQLVMVARACCWISLLFLGLLLVHLVENLSQVNVKPVLTCKSLLSPQEFERQIKAWCKEAGEDVTYEFSQVSSPACTNVLFLWNVAIKYFPTFAETHEPEHYFNCGEWSLVACL